MKAKILVGAVSALLFGGAAFAGDSKDCPPGYDKKDTQANVGSREDSESLSIVQTEPVDSSIGGSGQVGMEQDEGFTEDEGFYEDEASGVEQDFGLGEGIGGSGQVNMQQGEVILRCQPVRGGTGTGGSGSFDEGFDTSESYGWDESYDSDVGAGGSGFQSEPLREPQVTPPAEPSSGAFTPIEEDQNVRRESPADMRGLTLMVGGGVEGYTGALAPEINPGPAYGVTAAIKPSKVLGLELGYSGAVNNLDERVGDLGGTSGPDLVRNGGQAAVTFGLGAAPVQPYVLGGIGFSDYNFRGTGATVAGFSDDTVGNVPVGAGLRTHIGNFTADLRANYNFLFDQDFAGVDDGLNENGRYSGTLNIGGTF